MIDRRRFSDSGEATTAAETDTPPPEAPAMIEAEADRAAAQFDVDQPVSFSTFVISLSTQALLHLGEIEDPATGRSQADLGAAQHVIDILGILKDKTRGNLEQPEERLLDAVLYDLRLKYVELVRGPAKEGA